MKSKSIAVAMLALISLSSVSVLPALAQSTFDQDQTNFAVALEESIADMETASNNLGQNDKDTAVTHASLPAENLYASMKPELDEYNSTMSEQVGTMLSGLGDEVKNSPDTQTAKNYLDNAKQVLINTETAVLGETLASNIQFKIAVIRQLLEDQIDLYGASVSNGQINSTSTFQQGTGYITRSQELYGDIKSQLTPDQVFSVETAYSNLLSARDNKVPLDTEDPLTDKVKTAFGGGTSANPDMSTYLTNVKNLINQAKSEYAAGNSTGAQDLVTNAYLNNFEYLEPTIAASNKTLDQGLETSIRTDLRDMIKNGAPVSDVSAKIDFIQSQLDSVASVVPEFGPIALGVFGLAIAVIVSTRLYRNKSVFK